MTSAPLAFISLAHHYGNRQDFRCRYEAIRTGRIQAHRNSSFAISRSMRTIEGLHHCSLSSSFPTRSGRWRWAHTKTFSSCCCLNSACPYCRSTADGGSLYQRGCSCLREREGRGRTTITGNDAGLRAQDQEQSLCHRNCTVCTASTVVRIHRRFTPDARSLSSIECQVSTAARMDRM